MNQFSSISMSARCGLALCALISLAACQANAPSTGGGATATIGATRLIERDVEAPDIFEVTEPGLWDGRPSLGGVWVAHPTATDPERVIIRNEDNGRFVIGALFRRERDTPGPALMVSSDAAAALNILAGSPTRLQVTALRREDVPEPVITPPPDAPSPAQTASAPGAAITATPLADPIAAAEAAIARSDPSRAPPPPASAPAPAPQPEAIAAAPASGALDRPFVQIGIFSVEQNANNTAQALRSAGLVPTIYDQTSNGRRFWRVVVGPAQTGADRAAILQTVRGLGFQDAYVVTR
jgi:rare lipoprotein A